MERLAEPLDRPEKLCHPEAEPGLVVVGVAGEPGLQGRDPLGKATVKQESLGQRRLVGPHQRRQAGREGQEHRRQDRGEPS